uniref:Myb/SANT-like DNA-binding domain-containing protein n=1 Tax=Astyanax mexicanus TaxID=7994 RepID=A0A3B1ILQ3_ASTMX
MNRGLTWTSNEVQCLLDVWADDYICQLLQTTPKKSEVFKMFSKRMKERGFDRSPEQCHVKVKRLRQQDIKVRAGSSGEEKEKFPWFDDLTKSSGQDQQFVRWTLSSPMNPQLMFPVILEMLS